MDTSKVKLWGLLFVLLVIGSTVVGQPDDSLYQVNVDLLQNGTTVQKVTALQHMAESWRMHNKDSSIKLTYRSIELAKKMELPEKLSQSYNKLCEYYRIKGNADSVSKYGSIVMEKPYVSFLSAKDLLHLHFKLIHNHCRKAEWSKAYTLSHKLLEIPGVSQNNKAKVYLKIAHIMSNLKDFDKAIDYTEIARQCVKDTNETTLLSGVYYSKIEVYVHSRQLDSARYYSNKLLALSPDEPTSSYSYLTNRISHANILFQSDEYDEALDMLQFVEDSNINDIVTLKPSVNFLRGACYFKKKEYKKSVAFLEEAEQVAVSLGDSYDLDFIYDVLSEAYPKIGQYKKSVYCYQKLKETIEEESELEENAIINRMEIERIKQQKDRTIQELKFSKLQQELQNNRLKWIGLFFGLLVCTSGLIFYLYNKSRNSKFQEEISKNKLHALRAVMNPHFMFNSINTLQNFVLNSERYLAYNYITDLSKLLRSLLYNSETLYSDIGQEINLLENYVKLEQIRFKNNFQFSLQVDKSFEGSQLSIPSMIIQPYVENAIIHGLSNKEGDKLLDISIQKTETNYVNVTIRDNGIGRAAAAEIKAKNGKSHLSIATSNSRERIEILKRLGHKAANITIQDLVDTNHTLIETKVVILLPLLFDNASS